MEGFLVGLALLSGAVVTGIVGMFQAVPDGLGPMLDSLLSPFSNKRRWRHIQYRWDKFYDGLTRESLQSMWRAKQLRDTRPIAKQLKEALSSTNSFRCLFEDFAIDDGKTGRRVWNEEHFIAFIRSRMNISRQGATNTDDDGDAGSLATSAARALWRQFYCCSTYPFTDTSIRPEDRHIDLKGWIQAVATLNYPYVSLNWEFEDRRRTSWSSFFGLSLSLDTTVEKKAEDGWQPPSVLDDVSGLACSRLPVPVPMKRPSVEKVLPRVRRLVSESEACKRSADSFTLPYQDMLGLVSAILQVDKGECDWENRHCPSPVLSPDIDVGAQRAAATAILNAGGIQGEKYISFAKYLDFSETFYISKSHFPYYDWSFGQELNILWRAILTTSENSIIPDPPQHPSPLVLQTVDFLRPFVGDTGEHASDRRNCRNSSLQCLNDLEAGLSHSEVLKAMTWEAKHKFMVIHGLAPTVQTPGATRRGSRDSQRGQATLHAIISYSPLWVAYPNGSIVDYRVGDGHVLMELFPKPRALYFLSEQTKFVDIVRTDNGRIDFGRKSLDDGLGFTAGMSIDFQNRRLTMSSRPEQEGEERYIEIPVGPRAAGEGRVAQVDTAEAWESVTNIQKIEVFNSGRGVYVGLDVEREL